MIQWSVFRRWRNRGETRRQDKRYTVQLRLPNGTLTQRAAYTDRASSEQLAMRMVREAERKEVGLHDQFGQARKAPIAQHLAAFVLAMSNGTLARRRRSKPGADYIKRAEKRLKFLFSGLGVTRLEHLNQTDAERWFVDRVSAGWSDKTRDDHAALLRQFGSWLVDDQRWPSNPFHRLRPTRTEASRTFWRHALSVAELEQLVAAAEVRGVQQYAKVNPYATPETVADLQRKGRDRAALYQTAAYTGLRRRELMALVWDDVTLGAEPSLDVRAETQKTKRRVRIEVPAWLGEQLQGVRDRQAAALGGLPAATAQVFGTLSYRHITEQLKLDAVWAGFGRLDEESGRVLTDGGKVIDLHALRGTLATLAAEVGMPVRMLQQHMRHSDIRITMGVYAQVRDGALREQIELLPAPRSARGSATSPRSIAGDCGQGADGENRRGVGT